jgi:hypothetical protein
MVVGSGSDGPRRTWQTALAVCGTAALAVAVAIAPSAASASPFAWLTPTAAPASWKQITLPTKIAVLSIPPQLHTAQADANAVSADQKDSHGHFLAYVNATPKQGSESLTNWPSFRAEHLRDESAVSVKSIATAKDVPFRGGRGSCLMDVYVTKVKHNAYREIACYVQGRTGGSVIIAAAPPSQWAKVGPVLERVVAAYRAR